MKSRILPDIIVLEPNVTGNDYVLGDIHGYKNTLEKVTKILKNSDRLFIVGDLTDRGAHNIEVIEMLAKLKANPNGPKIFVTTGNHEVFCLNTIAALENIFVQVKNDQSIFEDHTLDFLVEKVALDNDEVRTHSMDGNGGKWLQKLFLDEIGNKKIFIQDDVCCYAENSKISLIKTFLKCLPYIIRVNGGNGRMAFNVVHADMPINDNELLRRIRIKYPFLTFLEKDYAIWARVDDYFDFGQNPYSTLTYVGHCIVVYDHPSTRPNTNTLNLDFGNYATKVAFMVDHTNRQTFAVLGEQREESAAFIPIPDIDVDNKTEMAAEKQKLNDKIRPFWRNINKDILNKFCQEALTTQEHIHYQKYYQTTAQYIGSCLTTKELRTKISKLSDTITSIAPIIQLTNNNNYLTDKKIIQYLLEILQKRVDYSRTQKFRLFDITSLRSNIKDEKTETINILKQRLNPPDCLQLNKAGTCFTTHLK